MKLLFSHLKWIQENPVQPKLFLADLESGKIIEKTIAIGDDFHIKTHEGGYCVGAETSTGWISCARNRKMDYPLKTQKDALGVQCDQCQGAEYFSCRIRCIGDICVPSSPQAKEACSTPDTGIYLTQAATQNKVGVSRVPLRRWIEQGSDFSILFAELPGLEARRLEQRIFYELGISQAISVSKKIGNIGIHDKAEFERLIKSKLPKILELYEQVKEEANVEGQAYPNPKIINLQNFHGFVNGVNKKNEFIPQPKQEFGGEIVAVKGGIIVVTDAKLKYALNTKKLQGWVIELIESAENKGQFELNSFFE